MTYRGRTTPAKASLIRSRLRHKRSLRRSAAADVAAHAIDGKKNVRGTLPRLVSLVVLACWVLVRTSVAGGDTDGVEVVGGGEEFHRELPYVCIDDVTTRVIVLSQAPNAMNQEHT